MKKRLLIGLLAFFSAASYGQPNMQRDSSIQVNANGSPLKFPWAGGLNFINWGLLDLDADGFKDIVAYDKSGAVFRTFINDKVSGQVSFTHNSVYEDKFPFINSWFSTYDYNCDGLMDIFTYDYPGPGGGIRVFRNTGNMQFVQMCDYLQSDYSTGVTPLPNIPDNGIGIPGLVDVDTDGDMDIIVFDVMSYSVECHQNQSKELGYNCDSLIFKVTDRCWGKFNEGLCQVTLNVCPFPREQPSDSVANVMHAGSGLMCFDADGDGLIDLLEGDLSCDSMFFMSNKGTVSDAHITSYTTLYPPSKPIAMSIFPTTYFLDLNNDNKRDLIAAPNWQGSENVNNQWLYVNTGADNSPNFNYVKNNFLQESMIDLGEGAYPTLFDYEGDGDLDLLVGNFGSYSASGDTSAIAFFKNTGTNTSPTFSLITTNFANLSSLHVQNMAPTTEDMDGDGDPDLLIGNNIGQFYYFTNTGGAGNPAVFSSSPSSSFGSGFLHSMDVGSKAAPQIIDLDKDGRLDILSGNQRGMLKWFRNTGTVNVPSFSPTPTIDTLGRVDVLQNFCNSLGNSMPFVFSYGGSYKMLVGSECGNMFLYDVPVPANLSSPFPLINSHAYGINIGEHVAPVLYDVNGDARLDMILGNYSGGLIFYRGLSTTYNDVAEHAVYTDMRVFPNPASGYFTVKFNERNLFNKKMQMTDLSGRIVKEYVFNGTEKEISVTEFSDGIYLLQIEVMGSDNSLQNSFTQKVVISHD